MISLLHTTRRPEAAKRCQELWLSRADNTANVEIVTAVDVDDVASQQAFPNAIIVQKPNGCCAGYNAAAAASVGDILVLLDDDWEPPHGWDEIIVSRIGGGDVLFVGDKHRKDDLICHPIITRRFYEDMGYFLHPSFKSVYCDNFFTLQAKARGFVDATDVEFLHANPSQGYGTEDDVARASNSPERYSHGEAAFKRLTEENMVIGFTACDRPEWLKESLDSWLETNLSLATSIHFFIEPSDKLDAVVAVIDAFAEKSPTPVIKHFNKEKQGVLRNPWNLFENLFNVQMATFAVLAEDDFLVSPDILDFFASTRHDEKTLAICAKNDGVSSNEDPSQFVQRAEFTGNIWGTWKSIWQKYLRDTWDFDYSSGNQHRDGSTINPDLPTTPSGWDWNIGLRVIPQNGLHCNLPRASRSFHIGVTGVHCTEEGYQNTCVKNFVKEKYTGSYWQVLKDGFIGDDTLFGATATAPEPAPHKGMLVSSVGDFGDVIMLAGIIKQIPGAPHRLGLRLNPNVKAKDAERLQVLYSATKELLLSQPYIQEVKIISPDDAVDWKSEDFRGNGQHFAPGETLMQAHINHLIKIHGIGSGFNGDPWLSVEPSPVSKGRIVINRTERYRNDFFSWGDVVRHYGSRLLFVGLPHEHQQFCDQFGQVDFMPTTNLLDVANIIAGSELFIGNQSCANAIALGLGHPLIQEVCLWIPDCIFKRDNATYVGFGECVLPDIGGSGECQVDFTPNVKDINPSNMPPGGWQFPGEVSQMHLEAASSALSRNQRDKFPTPVEARAAILMHNFDRLPSFFSNLDMGGSKYKLAMQNAGQKI